MRAGMETRPYAQSNVGDDAPQNKNTLSKQKPPLCKGRWHTKCDGGVVLCRMRRRHPTSSLLTLTYYFKKDRFCGLFSYSNRKTSGLPDFSRVPQRSTRR